MSLSLHPLPTCRDLAAIAMGTREEDAVTSALAQMILDDPEDPWIRRAVLSGAEHRALETVLAGDSFRETPGSGRVETARDFAAAVGARGEVGELKGVFASLGAVDETRLWWQNAAITGLADGLRRHRGKLGHKQLGTRLADPAKELAAHGAACAGFL